MIGVNGVSCDNRRQVDVFTVPGTFSTRATGRVELLFWQGNKFCDRHKIYCLVKRERERRRDPRAMAREGAQIFNAVNFV